VKKVNGIAKMKYNEIANHCEILGYKTNSVFRSSSFNWQEKKRKSRTQKKKFLKI